MAEIAKVVCPICGGSLYQADPHDELWCGRCKVTMALESVAEPFPSAATAKTVIEAIHVQIDKEERACKICLERLAKDKNKSPVGFVAYLHSLWADYGERNTQGWGVTTAAAIAAAEAEFKVVNERDDVQASYRLVAVMPSGTEYTIPERFYKEEKKNA